MFPKYRRNRREVVGHRSVAIYFRTEKWVVISLLFSMSTCFVEQQLPRVLPYWMCADPTALIDSFNRSHGPEKSVELVMITGPGYVLSAYRLHRIFDLLDGIMDDPDIPNQEDTANRDLAASSFQHFPDMDFISYPTCGSVGLFVRGHYTTRRVQLTRPVSPNIVEDFESAWRAARIRIPVWSPEEGTPQSLRTLAAIDIDAGRYTQCMAYIVK